MQTKAIVAVLAFSALSTSALAKDYSPESDDFSLEYACEGFDEKVCKSKMGSDKNGRVSWDEIIMFDFKHTDYGEGFAHDWNEDGEVVFDEYKREVYLYSAGLARHAERYDEMMKYMHEIVMMNGRLSEYERELFLEAYEIQLAKLRKSYRSVPVSKNKHREKITNLYRKKIESEMTHFI